MLVRMGAATGGDVKWHNHSGIPRGIMVPPYDPAIPCLSIYPRRWTVFPHKDSNANIHGSIIQIMKTWKQMPFGLLNKEKSGIPIG